MPRTAKNTKEKILNATREYIRMYPGQPVSMRRIASLCSISAGTIYNHYPDKDSLMAAVMIEDWHKALARMDENCAKAGSFREGICGIYEPLCVFEQTFHQFWMNYSVSGNYAVMQNQRHRQLVGEIAAFVKGLLERFASADDLAMADILAENILNAAVREDISVDILLRLAAYIAD